MRENANNRKALNILRRHYARKEKPRVISLYTQLTSLKKNSNENMTDNVIAVMGELVIFPNTIFFMATEMNYETLI